MKKYAPNSLVPVLLTDREVVQGSSEIIDFLDKHDPEKPLTPPLSVDVLPMNT